MVRWLVPAVKFGRDEAGATIVEFTLLLVFVLLASAAAVTQFGSALSGLFQRAVNGFSH